MKSCFIRTKMWFFVTIFLAVDVCQAAPTTASPELEEPTELINTTTFSQEDILKAQEYLSSYFSEVGVAAPNSTWNSSLDAFDETLKKMQEFFGLEVTGELDSNTLQVMDRPRCGFNDVTRYSNFDNQPMWDKSVVTYRITNYTPDLSPSEVDATIAKALRVYRDVIPLEFKQIFTGTADIMIIFQAEDHGDFAPFDGSNGVLAHAFSPGEGRGGDTHFDEDENWSIDTPEANLFLVAAHEFGHALGLAHSKNPAALMFPTYQYVNTEGYKLPHGDKKEIQAIYGNRLKQPKTAAPTSRPAVDRCSLTLSFDAVTSIRTNLYFFKDKYVWRKSSDSDGISRKKIRSVWSGINRVDAAYTYDSSVYFFEGNRYWKLIGKSILPGYPKPLREFGFPASVTKIDAAVHVSFVGKTLFFVRNRFWSYNERRGRMEQGYPKFIFRDLPGIGLRVDAAVEVRGYLYFSTGSIQTEYDYQRRRALRSYVLFMVAAHEFGHSLGLSHYDDPGALMYPVYFRNLDTFVLPWDDVNEIESLYDPAEVPPPTSPDACDSNMVLDAVATLRGEMLFFKDSFFWRSYPQSNTPQQSLITNFWANAPSNIDAAYESKYSDRLYIFKGRRVWAYSGYTPVQGYPKKLTSFGLPSNVNEINAALYDVESGKTLFIVGNHIYSYNEARRTMDTGNPQSVDSFFHGLINPVSAAFQYRGFTYIYNGPFIFEYNLRSKIVFRVLRNSYFLHCNNF